MLFYFEYKENCPNTIVCRNGGFLTVECKCYCPDGLTGSNCETVIINQSCKYRINFKTKLKK